MVHIPAAFVSVGFSRVHGALVVGRGGGLGRSSLFGATSHFRPAGLYWACGSRGLRASASANDGPRDGSEGLSGSSREEDGSLGELGRPGGSPGALEERGAGVVAADLRKEMSKSYMEYAMSVILGRALPDIRDGLKPVHRRILFAMHGLGIGSKGPYRKCARVVGEVLGKYHPHGDTAVYDALVRMAQDFSMSVPLVDGHGNFGSTDGDPAAAMRYTECRLSPLARDAFLDDLDKGTVTFGDNFDGSEREPLVLPATIPNLLLNGSSGIAVGMATNIPPHNLGELVRALIAIIKKPDIEDSELLKLVPAPDFPTGGQILGTDDARELYLSGRGRVLVRAKAHFEVLEDSSASGRRSMRDAVVVTELPYQVNKAVLVAKIAELVNDKKLDGIVDLRDESDRTGTRIVIELKRDAERAVVLNNLYKRTSLQHSFSGNLLALDNGMTPIRFTLRDFLTKFLVFRKEMIRKRVAFTLARAKARMHLVEGFLIAQNSLDEVISSIRASENSQSALRTLEKDFSLSKAQAEAVLAMQLRRLTGLERNRLESEAKDLKKSITDLSDVLARDSRVDEIIVEELNRETAKHGKPRRSVIVRGADLDATEIDELSLVSNDQSVIVMTQQGYIKRMLSNEFVSQNRGTRGKQGVGNTRDKDAVAHFFSCMTHDVLLAISKRGIAYALPAHKVPIGSRTSRGTPVFQLLSDEAIAAGETMASVLPVSEFRDNEFLALLTKNGTVKKTALSAFENMNIRGKIAITLQDGDELKWVRRCVETDSMIIASQSGKAVRIGMDSKTVRASGRQSIGVRSMRMREGDEIADMDILHGVSEDEDVRYLLLVTSDGRGKRVEAKEFRKLNRGCAGVIALRFKSDGSMDGDSRLVAMKACYDNDSVMLATKQGTIVRQSVGSIPTRARRTMPIIMQRVDTGDEVAAVTVLPPEFVGDEDEDEFDVPDRDGELMDDSHDEDDSLEAS